MIFWGRKQPDLSPWQVFAWGRNGTSATGSMGASGVFVVPRFDGTVAAQAQIDGGIQTVPQLDAQVDAQG